MRWRDAIRDPWVWGQLGLFLLVGVILPLAGRRGGAPDFLALEPLGSRLPGLLPLLAGLRVIAAAVPALGRNLTPATTPVPEGQLIRTGPYARVRHPMYSGLILVLLGFGWVLCQWRVGLLSGVLGWAYFDRKAAAEERKLAQRYPDYPSYSAMVPKLIPRFFG